jgi:hypothetical protein
VYTYISIYVGQRVWCGGRLGQRVWCGGRTGDGWETEYRSKVSEAPEAHQVRIPMLEKAYPGNRLKL